MKAKSEAFLRRRKFLLVLPLLVMPFITMAFWALDGGKGQSENVVKRAGLNEALPDAQFKDESLDKMSMYSQAYKDSVARQHRSGRDPYSLQDTAVKMSDYNPGANNTYGPYNGNAVGYQDQNEAKVRERLASLERSLNQPPPPTLSNYSGNNYGGQGSSNAEIDRLEQMMRTMNGDGSGDPEMRQLGQILEKIQEIQNPQLAREKLKEISSNNKGRVYTVVRLKEEAKAALMGPKKAIRNSGFYDTDEIPTQDNINEPAIPAVVHGTQTVLTGNRVKMRLSEDIYINGTLIPAGHFVFGKCALNGERLQIDITNINFQNHFFPVNLSVYDYDALEGICIPGSINRDASKDGAERALQSVQLMSMDPSIGAQAAGAGVEVAKGLFSKKAKLVRVTVKAGHPILLMDLKAR